MNKAVPKKYDFKEFKKFEPTLQVSRRTLRKGQASLYDLIVDKLASGDAVTLAEAKDIWLTKVCRNMVNGKPHSWVWRYDHKREAYTSVLEPMNDEAVNFTVMNWLTRTIGILVIKGYIKIIPMVQLV